MNVRASPEAGEMPNANTDRENSNSGKHSHRGVYQRDLHRSIRQVIIFLDI